jgi:hypothetical protein
MKCLIAFALIFTVFIACKTTQMPARSSSHTDAFLKKLLWEHEDKLGRKILAHPEKYKLQILYIQINRDSLNRPSFKEYAYHLDSNEYFYPASTVKMPIAFTALEKLNKIGLPGLTKYTPMYTDSVYPGTSAVTEDTTATDGKPSIAHYIKKIFLVSDNDAANRLYEFIGRQKLNRSLHEKEYTKTDILQRLDISLSEDQNRHTNPVKFVKNGRVIYSQPEMYDPSPAPQRHNLIGKAYTSNGKLVKRPMDFSHKNRASLPDLLHILQAIIFPEAVPTQRRFELSEDDYLFLYKWMSAYPPESQHPYYDPEEYGEAYIKFLMYGGDPKEKIPSYIRIFNKPGWAYGFLTDVAYVADFKHKVEFMLAATLYVNSDGILNDDHYEYDKIGKPFLKNLGQIIYSYELKRERKYLPNLSRYRTSE